MKNHNIKNADDLDVDLNKSCHIVKMIVYMKDTLKMTSNIKENSIITTQQRDTMKLSTNIQS